MRIHSISDRELDERRFALRQEHLRRTDTKRSCVLCRSGFFARADALYCSGKCRVAAFRKRARVEQSPQPASTSGGSLAGEARRAQ